MYAMCSIGFESKPLRCLGGDTLGAAKRQANLEADCTLGEVLLRGEANTGNPTVSVGVEALEDAELVLHLSKLCWRLALELLAKVEPANLSIACVEEEEDMLLLILDSVELAGTCGVGCIIEAD